MGKNMLVELQNRTLIGDMETRYGRSSVVITEMPVRDFPFVVDDQDYSTGEIGRKGYGRDLNTAFLSALGSSEGRRAYENWGAFNRAVSIVEAESRHRDRIILEGPPIYLWPKEDHPTESIESMPATNGWLVLNEISERLEGRNPDHFVMIDQFNNRPEDAVDTTPEDELRRITGVSHLLSGLPILQPDSAREIFQESDFAGQDESRNTCFSLDATFQVRKILSVLESEMSRDEIIARLSTTLLVVVHPDTFQAQQTGMMSALMGAMKEPPFSVIPKDQRKKIISSLYTHVWLDESGKVSSVTKPQWDGNKFIHSEVAYEN